MTTREFVDNWELDTLTIVDIEASDTLIFRIEEREAAYRATVAAALRELWADVLRLPTADYSTDGDGAELIKQDAVLKLIDATIAKLGLEEV